MVICSCKCALCAIFAPVFRVRYLISFADRIPYKPSCIIIEMEYKILYVYVFLGYLIFMYLEYFTTLGIILKLIKFDRCQNCQCLSDVLQILQFVISARGVITISDSGYCFKFHLNYSIKPNTIGTPGPFFLVFIST